MLSELKPITLQQNEDLVIKFEGLVQVNPHAKRRLFVSDYTFLILTGLLQSWKRRLKRQ